MRGVISAGMVVALEQLGWLAMLRLRLRLLGGRDSTARTSWRARPALGTTIYYENINHRRFIDLLRPLRGGRSSTSISWSTT